MRRVPTPFLLVVAATLGQVLGCGGGDDLSGPDAGTLEVTTTTTGSNPDADGYAISLDGAAGVAITPAGSHRFSELSPGDHQVELSGLAANCRVEGENPRAVTVVEGSGAAVVFAVVCSEAPTTSSLIAFGSEGLGDAAIFVVRPDGTGLQRLSPEGALDREPVWSPDHGRILFASGDDLYVMNADGSGRAPMVEAQGVSDYRWSPDGRQIAFVSTVFEDDNILDEVWVVQADGSGRLRLATNATTPTWSPDGARLAYVSSLDFSDLHIRVINADGSGDVRLTDESLAAFEPAWSPDGTRIAFVTVDERDIYLINPDGTGLINLTNGVGDDDEPAWSPDGRRLAFNTTPPEQPLESEIAVMNADGTGRTGLTNRPGFDFSPDWSPDGTQLVYHQSGDLDTEIFVMNADGSGQLNVSNRPNNEESSADWSGGGQAAAAGRQAQAKRLRQAER